MFYAFILHIFSVALHLKLMYDVKGLENVSNGSVAMPFGRSGPP